MLSLTTFIRGRSPSSCAAAPAFSPSGPWSSFHRDLHSNSRSSHRDSRASRPISNSPTPSGSDSSENSSLYGGASELGGDPHIPDAGNGSPRATHPSRPSLILIGAGYIPPGTDELFWPTTSITASNAAPDDDCFGGPEYGISGLGNASSELDALHATAYIPSRSLTTELGTILEVPPVFNICEYAVMCTLHVQNASCILLCMCSHSGCTSRGQSPSAVL
jgi:hypothetical protein